jgi:hypothetical protein
MDIYTSLLFFRGMYTKPGPYICWVVIFFLGLLDHNCLQNCLFYFHLCHLGVSTWPRSTWPARFLGSSYLSLIGRPMRTFLIPSGLEQAHKKQKIVFLPCYLSFGPQGYRRGNSFPNPIWMTP